jgi:hypothetical protein
VALITFGPVVSSVRGSSGGTVFSRNGLGAYIRNRTTPINPRTSRQEAHRAILATLNYDWANTLTQAERNSWEGYAAGTPILNRLGDQQHLKGLQMYIRTNLCYVSAGGTQIVDAPPVAGVISIPTVTITGAVATGVRVTAVAAPAMGAGDLLLFYISPPKKFTNNFFGSGFTSTFANLGTVTPPLQLVAAAGCAIGQRYFIDVKRVAANGAPSSRYLRHVDITA